MGGLLSLLLAIPGQSAGAPNLTNFLSFSRNIGTHPTSSLLLAADGNFYGTTFNGGVSNSDSGLIYRLTPGGARTTLVTFNTTNGANPYAGLLQASDGNIYGTTSFGGASSNGTVFQLATNGQFKTLASFGATNGSNPKGTLAQGSDGNLYGTTYAGGTNGGLGTIFKITTSGALTSLFSFNGANGANPLCALALAKDGSFYGTASTGGSNGLGTVFQITTNGQFTMLLSFNGTNGANPDAGLVRGKDGNYYGTTYAGGDSGAGTVFGISPAGLLTLSLSFETTNGAAPNAPVIQCADGNFYGTTEIGGSNNNGTVFELTSAGILNSLVSLDPLTGNLPLAGLTAGPDGDLYGTSQSGDFYGNIFRLSIPMAPFFYAPTLGGGNIFLAWSSVVGDTYQVQYVSDPGQTNWTNLGGQIIATNAITTSSDSITSASRRFYRCVLMDP